MTHRPSTYLSTLVLLLVFSIASAQTYVELVLDASGSMWNRLADGEYRIVAAKDVLTSFISGLPADDGLNVGLRVYGSQMSALTEGACQDSSLFVPLDGVRRDDLLRTVRDTQARGATPIAYSLEAAAADFPSAGRKIIVLVTDGEESCGGDVRATLEALRARGIDVELKVIGFDLDDRAIRSFEGLGTFENARSAGELAAALGRAVEVGAAQIYPVSVSVTRGGVPATEGVLVTLVDSVSDETYTLAPTAPGTLRGEVRAGSYEARVEDASSSAPVIVSGLNVTPESGNTLVVELEPAVTVTLNVTPAQPVAGSTVTVNFSGAPESSQNWVTVVPVDLPDDAYLAYERVSGTSAHVTLQLPNEAATLEARYHLERPEGGSQVIGRSAPFTTTAMNATLSVPAEVVGGSSLQVTWTGPNNDRDYITIVPADAPAGAYETYAYTREGSPLTLTAPVAAGVYEVRYQSDRGTDVIARASIAVVGGEYTVRAPAEVMSGSPFEVTWSGPSAERDYLTIVPVGTPEGEYLDYAYVAAGNPVSLNAPLEAGAYEVRYATEQTSPNRTLASTPMTVLAASYTVRAPSRIGAGESFTVTWSGPNNDGDYLTIVPLGAPEGDYLDYAYTYQGNPVTLIAPDEAGRYEVRYSTEQTSPNPILASTPITVD